MQSARVDALLQRIRQTAGETGFYFEDVLSVLDYCHGRVLLEALATWRPETLARRLGKETPGFRLVLAFGFSSFCGPHPPFSEELAHFEGLEHLRQINAAVQLRRQQLAGSLPPLGWQPPELALSQSLQHEDPHVRAWACAELCRNHWATATAHDELVGLLKDPVAYVADWAWLALFARLMAETTAGPTAPIIAAAAKVPGERQPLVLVCLSLLGCEAQVLPRVAELLASRQADQVDLAWWCIQILGYKVTPIAAAIRPFLNHPDDHWLALRCLAHGDPPLVDELVAAACALPSLEQCNEDAGLPHGKQRFGVVGVLRDIVPLLGPDHLLALGEAVHPGHFVATFKAVGARGQALAPRVVQWFHAATEPLDKVDYLEMLGLMGGETAFGLLRQEVGFWWGTCGVGLVGYGARGIAVLGSRWADFSAEDRRYLYTRLANKGERLPHELGDLVEADLDHADQETRWTAARVFLQCGPEESRLRCVTQFFLDELPALDEVPFFYHELARPLAHALAARLAGKARLSITERCVSMNALGLAMPYSAVYQGLLQDLADEAENALLREAAFGALRRIQQPESLFNYPFRVFLKKPKRDWGL